MEQNLINRLVNTFKDETLKYSNLFEGVVDYKCEEFFKKNNPEKGYHSVDASIIFKNFIVKLEYKVNISALIPKSTVEIRFMLENGKLPVEYSMYDLLNIIDKNNFKCYTFTYVTSDSKMKEVLKYLVDAFEFYKDKIEELSTNNDQITNLEKIIEDNIKLLLNERIFESRDAFYLMHMLELYYILDISRFTMEGYLDYTSGKYKHAIKKYNKLQGKMTCYEQRLLEYIKTGNVKEPIENTLNTFREASKLKSIKMELVPILLACMFLTPIWCIVYNLIFYITLYLTTRGNIYVGGAEPLILFMPAFITAIINSFFIRKNIYKILFRKNYEKIIALDEIENGSNVINIMTKLFQFIIALGIIFSILTANTNISFYEENFKINLDFLNLKGESIQYQSVYCVYRANGLKNDFGKVVNNPTYVIVLNDGRQINLYYYMEYDEIKENIIPIFKKYNIEIREIDLVDNIQPNINI